MGAIEVRSLIKEIENDELVFAEKKANDQVRQLGLKNRHFFWRGSSFFGEATDGIDLSAMG